MSVSLAKSVEVPSTFTPCDRCGARSVFTARKITYQGSQSLDLCGHHAYAHEQALTLAGFSLSPRS